MREQRPGIKNIVSDEIFPLVGKPPAFISGRGQWKRRRAEAEHVEDCRFVVPFPSVMEKAAFRLPSLRDSFRAVLRPAPIDPAVQRVRQSPDLHLVAATIEVAAGCKNACDQ